MPIESTLEKNAIQGNVGGNALLARTPTSSFLSDPTRKAAGFFQCTGAEMSCPSENMECFFSFFFAHFSVQARGTVAPCKHSCYSHTSSSQSLTSSLNRGGPAISFFWRGSPPTEVPLCSGWSGTWIIASGSMGHGAQTGSSSFGLLAVWRQKRYFGQRVQGCLT